MAKHLIDSRVTHLLILLLIAGFVQAQQIADYRFNLGFTKAGGGVMNVELGLNRDLFNFYDNDLRLGFGVRMGLQNNKDVTFASAGKEWKEKDNTIDYITFEQIQSMSFNLYAQAEYYVKPKLSGGINLDLLGISTGPTKNGNYRPGVTSMLEGFKAKSNVEAKATQANAFSFSNSKGSLVSQVYGRFEPNKHIAFKIGYAFVLSEISTVETQGNGGQFRFENNTGGVFFGFSYNKFDNK
jgi:hypothetical protein